MSELSDKQEVHSLVIVDRKHAAFYSEWNGLFPTSTFSLNDVFPAWTGTQRLYVLIIYTPARRIVRPNELRLQHSSEVLSTIRKSESFQRGLMLENAAAYFVNGYK